MSGYRLVIEPGGVYVATTDGDGREHGAHAGVDTLEQAFDLIREWEAIEAAPLIDDGLDVGTYVYREDGPRGDDEGVVLALREMTAVIASAVHGDRIVYLRTDLRTDEGTER